MNKTDNFYCFLQDFVVFFVIIKRKISKYMAKKNVSTSVNGSIIDIINAVDNSAEILSSSKTAVISDYIDTGSYILNACMTGSIYKGIPNGRCVVLAGAPGSGKSYLALSICRNAQKKGYTPIYIDSEFSIDKEFVERLGCDSSNFIIKPVTTITEVSTFMANVLAKINEMPEESRTKVIFVLDSLGNLTSSKELTTTLDGGTTKDMTKQQEIKALFRTNATAIGKAKAIFIVNTHIYKTLDLFSSNVVSGGSGINYNASITMMLSTSKLDDKESDKIVEQKVGEYTKTGVIVTAKPEKSRFTIPQKVRFQIPFFKAPNPYVGLEAYITWENSGILRGKIFTQKEYDKLSDNDKKICKEFTNVNGEQVYAYPKETSRSIIVKHLGGEVPVTELFTSKVLTDDILRNLDELCIRPSFELPSQDSDTDINELIDNE
jgi:RecA/RadA recombinase